jgi:hypothetical protein
MSVKSPIVEKAVEEAARRIETKSRVAYLSVEPSVYQQFEHEAELRQSSISRMLYMLLFQVTDGFTNFAAADRPLHQPNKE